MQNDIKFSIVVPVYNVEQYLSKCLDSLINQTYPNIEIICINDGSTDNSLQRLEEYAQKDNRIRIINQENQGVSVARNTGLKSVTGDYILFVDPDDWLELYTCEKLKNVVKNKECDIVFFNYNIIRTNYTQKINTINCINLNDNSTENYFNKIKYSLWSKLYKRELITENNIQFPLNIKVTEDAFFEFIAIDKAKTYELTDEYFYNYLSIKKGSASKNSNGNLDSIVKCYEQFKETDTFLNWDEEKQYRLLDHWAIMLYGSCLILGYYNQKIDNNIISDFIKKFNLKILNYPIKYYGYKKLKFLLRLRSYNLFGLYVKLIRPFGKYCIVLPYRRIKKFLRKKNG